MFHIFCSGNTDSWNDLSSGHIFFSVKVNSMISMDFYNSAAATTQCVNATLSPLSLFMFHIFCLSNTYSWNSLSLEWILLSIKLKSMISMVGRLVALLIWESIRSLFMYDVYGFDCWDPALKCSIFFEMFWLHSFWRQSSKTFSLHCCLPWLLS
jgi:hypothetical protein